MAVDIVIKYTLAVIVTLASIRITNFLVLGNTALEQNIISNNGNKKIPNSI